MFVLDTNIISEMMRPRPDRSAMDWLNRHSQPTLYTTTICEAEIRYGLEIMPDGKRRRGLQDDAAGLFNGDMAERVLPFDRTAALEYAEIGARLRALGHGFETADLQIAAITRAHGFTLATRNTRHFAHCGVDLIDPFTQAAGR